MIEYQDISHDNAVKRERDSPGIFLIPRGQAIFQIQDHNHIKCTFLRYHLTSVINSQRLCSVSSLILLVSSKLKLTSKPI